MLFRKTQGKNGFFLSVFSPVQHRSAPYRTHNLNSKTRSEAHSKVRRSAFLSLETIHTFFAIEYKKKHRPVVSTRSLRCRLYSQDGPMGGENSSNLFQIATANIVFAASTKLFFLKNKQAHLTTNLTADAFSNSTPGHPSLMSRVTDLNDWFSAKMQSLSKNILQARHTIHNGRINKSNP